MSPALLTSAAQRETLTLPLIIATVVLRTRHPALPASLVTSWTYHPKSVSPAQQMSAALKTTMVRTSPTTAMAVSPTEVPAEHVQRDTRWSMVSVPPALPTSAAVLEMLVPTTWDA